MCVPAGVCVGTTIYKNKKGWSFFRAGVGWRSAHHTQKTGAKKRTHTTPRKQPYKTKVLLFYAFRFIDK